MSTQVVQHISTAKPICRPCLDRGTVSAGAHLVAGDWFCKNCFNPERKVRPMPYRKVQQTKIDALAYMGHIEPQCVRCKGPRKKQQLTCDDCTKVIQKARYVKTWLRAYRDKGSIKCLQNAMSYVRRYQVKPEDLEGC